MLKLRNGVVVLLVVFLAGLFNVFGDEPVHRSGIAGQVFLVQSPALGAFPGSPVSPPEPFQVTLLVFAQIGNNPFHVRLIGKFETAPDGTFSIPLPPGTYVVEPDPSLGYFVLNTGHGQFTVVPHQVTFEEIDVIGGGWGAFPG